MFELYTSRIFQWSVAILLVIFIATDIAFSTLQGMVSFSVSAIYATFYCGLLTLLILLTWVPLQFTGRIGVALVTALIAIGGLALAGFAAAYTAGSYDAKAFDFFSEILAVRIFISALCFVIAIQFYKAKLMAERDQSELTELTDQEPETSDQTIDHIAVKKGNNVHIVSIDELIYVRADGDYVTLVTAEGNYLKDETMKYLEKSLPSSRFVRIHRSYIVNIETIDRIELSDKDAYSVILKNGINLRASSNGYKLLKVRLSL